MENASELQTPDALPALSPAEDALLARAREIAATLLEPRAEAVDNSGEPPAENLRALAHAGLVGVTTPVEWGGHGCSGAFQRAYTETLTAACGTTWFVLTQHLGSCTQLANSENPTLRERFLRKMASGDHYVGVGFGHLRRPEPLLRAEPVDGGWLLNGVAPWVTGWPILHGVIYGAVLPGEEQRHLFVYVPAEESEHHRSTPPIPLCAMNASVTTAVHLDDLFVPQTDFVRYSSRAEMARGDYNGIAGGVTPPLGCALGCVRHLRQIAARRKNLAVIATAADALEAEIQACYTEARRWSELPDKSVPEYKPNALHARAAALTLAVRAAHAAVTAAGGSANSRENPAQRRLREAMFYTLIAQTTDTLTAVLEDLTGRGGTGR
jgi:alkylation response protein AidB-like acyl-CoA dehydrogenase